MSVPRFKAATFASICPMILMYCSGAWLVLPTYMIYVMGGEIIDGLATASRGVNIKSD